MNTRHPAEREASACRADKRSATLAQSMARQTETPKPLLETAFEGGTLDLLRAAGFELAVIGSNT